jgi:hypothetical protein
LARQLVLVEDEKHLLGDRHVDVDGAGKLAHRQRVAPPSGLPMPASTSLSVFPGLVRPTRRFRDRSPVHVSTSPRAREPRQRAPAPSRIARREISARPRVISAARVFERTQARRSPPRPTQSRLYGAAD